jgi:hypothetical protein
LRKAKKLEKKIYKVGQQEGEKMGLFERKDNQ